MKTTRCFAHVPPIDKPGLKVSFTAGSMLTSPWRVCISLKGHSHVHGILFDAAELVVKFMNFFVTYFVQHATHTLTCGQHASSSRSTPNCRAPNCFLEPTARAERSRPMRPDADALVDVQIPRQRGRTTREVGMMLMSREVEMLLYPANIITHDSKSL